ncbi:MAG: Rrf2 family transcriptional regulator [Cyanothece sp. SIO2G6]|nr:Rrf2 family transcriptional regulator [Cyanothece sp. SIO2G6]
MPFTLSCKHEYALCALIELATAYASGQPLQSRQLAQRQHIPDRYLEQLLATLKRGGLIRSQRGVNGGYLLAHEPASISVLDVICCIDGKTTDDFQEAQPSSTAECTVIQEVWVEARQTIEVILAKYSLKDLAEMRDVRQNTNVMYYI